MTGVVLDFPPRLRAIQQRRLATARAANDALLFFDRCDKAARDAADAGDIELALLEIARIAAFDISPLAPPFISQNRTARLIQLVEYLVAPPGARRPQEHH